ncbi:4-hydroxy-2-oxovalerate aldolase [Streptomyces sp. NPDC008125]|uniref:4-hydroxy-2-oxovalerate aldolase n=1 Tax=Streptomyces sp. NPDC008125 TaxID=3364811 RepID=UPI0036E8A7CD
MRHQLGADQLRAYASAANAAGVPVVEVGHGNGLGASSLQLGRARLADEETITAVRECLTTSRLGVFLAPGWGTGIDLRAAVRHGADVVPIAAHCFQADVAERHLGETRAAGVEAQAVLLMSHMLGPAELADQCAQLIGFGAQDVGIMDSAGHYLPDDVVHRISAIREAAGTVPIIFHGHNNLGMAMANSLGAVAAGATVIDGCARGFGAGAGNTQLEVLAAVLQRTGHTTGIDLRRLLAAADIGEVQLMDAPPTIDSISLASGLAGVFSGSKLPVLDAARRGGVNPIDVLFELGRRQVVAGQEDQIHAVVRDLQHT